MIRTPVAEIRHCKHAKSHTERGGGQELKTRYWGELKKKPAQELFFNPLDQSFNPAYIKDMTFKITFGMILKCICFPMFRKC